MTEAYPIFIKQQGADFLVYAPDWDIYTEGNNFTTQEHCQLIGLEHGTDRHCARQTSDAQAVAGEVIAVIVTHDALILGEVSLSWSLE